METASLVATVKKELEKQNMTYKELSAISGVPLDTLNNFFRGKTKNPRIDTLHAIEVALGLSKPLDWTNEEKALGVGNHPTHLSEREWEWSELGSELLRTKGEEYYKMAVTMIKAIINEKS